MREVLKNYDDVYKEIIGYATVLDFDDMYAISKGLKYAYARGVRWLIRRPKSGGVQIGAKLRKSHRTTWVTLRNEDDYSPAVHLKMIAPKPFWFEFWLRDIGYAENH